MNEVKKTILKENLIVVINNDYDFKFFSILKNRKQKSISTMWPENIEFHHNKLFKLCKLKINK